MRRRWPVLLALAASALAVAAGDYVFIRGPRTLQVLQSIPDLPLTALRLRLPPTLLTIASSLPSATHAFALSVLTGLVLPASRSFILPACAFWGTVDTAFELLQGDASFISRMTENRAAVSVIHAYFSNGVFDSCDVAGIWIGTAVAGLALYMFTRAPVVSTTHDAF